MEFAGIIKAILDRLSISIGLSACCASGFFVFVPWMYVNLEQIYLVIAWLIFVFSSVYVFAEIVRWALGAKKSRDRSIRAARQNLRNSISGLLKSQSGLVGMRWVADAPSEVAFEIADKYARLNELGIKTPQIDHAAGEWDFDLHNRFLTSLLPFLATSPMKEVRAQARSILRRFRA